MHGATFPSQMLDLTRWGAALQPVGSTRPSPVQLTRSLCSKAPMLADGLADQAP